MASIGYFLQNYDFFCEKNCFIAKFHYVFSLKKMLVYVFL